MCGFAATVIEWHKSNGRHDLPWQRHPSPYRVWVSEIMLQQTRVTTVIPYFLRFMERFPDVAALAAADIDQVLHLWTGLGYYARARNLHKAAQCIVERHQGRIPDNPEELQRLSGIGRSTAGAILALAHGRPAPILDGNVKRVLARCFAIAGFPGHGKTAAALWTKAESLVPGREVAAYTQGMMDLGATVCTRSLPACGQCPLSPRCLARIQGAVDRYPGKKPGRVLPVRQTVMHILQDESGRVLLEKRPPTGVWGSLYSLPEALPEFCVAIEAPGQLPLIRHSFTHFHLDISPLRYGVRSRHDAVADSDRWLWYSIADPAEVGLTAPASKLLAGQSRQAGTIMTRMVQCRKYGKELPGLPAPPYPGEKGQQIFQTVSRQAWREWLAQQTMLINEKQLSLANAADREYLTGQMEKFLDNQDFDRAAGYVPPE